MQHFEGFKLLISHNVQKLEFHYKGFNEPIQELKFENINFLI